MSLSDLEREQEADRFIRGKDLRDRVMLLRIPISILAILLQAGSSFTVVGNPLPDDAEFLSWSLDGESRDILVKVRSGVFPEIDRGTRIPEMNPVEFRRD